MSGGEEGIPLFTRGEHPPPPPLPSPLGNYWVRGWRWGWLQMIARLSRVSRLDEMDECISLRIAGYFSFDLVRVRLRKIFLFQSDWP
jgi:hypothetical protein